MSHTPSLAADGVNSEVPKSKIPRWLVVVLLVLAIVPPLFATMHATNGSRYIGFEYNTDDHMVYAAWMRQAMDGRILMDNRFTVDPQPSLTLHLYFLILGWIAKLTGISLAAAFGRLFFSGLFLVCAARIIRRLQFELVGENLAWALLVFGGGTGFLFWQMFGQSIVKPIPALLKDLLNGTLPVDVWQPEAFVFPSMLTNGLFMVSLCLILTVFDSFLDARRGWQSVLPGFLSLGVLMNIHSYDVLTVALVMVAFLAASWLTKTISLPWLLRAAVIATGVIAPALWFLHVLHADEVFRARAATETFSPNFRGVLFGYLPLMAFGLHGALVRARSIPDRKVRNRRILAVGTLILLILGMALAARSTAAGFFMSPIAWVGVYVIAVVAAGMWAESNLAWNLIFAWAAVGTVAIYFPGLYQRKLTMGLSIPWSLLAAWGLYSLLQKAQAEPRRLYAACSLLVLCASSFLWWVRDIQFINQNVSNTTRHPVYLDADLVKILDVLNGLPGRKVVFALPGAGAPGVDGDGHPIPDSFSTPLLPDVAPILTGFTGAYSYAGHWSETPDIMRKNADMYRFLLREPYGSIHSVMDPAERREMVVKVGHAYAVIPSQDKGLPLVAPTSLGNVIYAGPIWTLVELAS